MKNIITIIILVSLSSILWTGCHEKTIGYLITENASYEPDSLIIPRIPDPEEEAERIKWKSPWITFNLQGYEGTFQIDFSIESVTSTAGEEQAKLFMEELSIRGGGAMLYPFEHKAGSGEYVVSIRLTNPGYSHVIKDAYKFIIE